MQYLMTQNPSKQTFRANAAVCNCQNYRTQFLLRVLKPYSVQCKKNQHGMSANSFITVYECMVFYQTEPEPGCLSLNRGIQICSPE